MMTATKTEAPAGRGWSDEQNRIFDWFETGIAPSVVGGVPTLDRVPNLIVRARAGTGKTTTVIEGVRRAPEARILLAAFNKNIANELQARCGGDGGRGSRVEARTLHGLGFRYIGRARPGVRVDEDGSRPMGLAERACGKDAPVQIVRLVRDLHSKVREIDPLCVNDRDARGVYDVASRFDLLPEEDWEARGWGERAVCDAAHRAMRFAMEPAPTIDYPDMIFLPIVMRWVRPWYDLVVVDEAQDMTLPQLTIAVGACRRGGRIAVVGDDRQAIYGFRGADSGSLDRLKAELRAAELGLTTTYRCCRRVVDLSRRIVPDYQAATGAPDGEVATMSADDMAAKVAEGDFVLSRKNAPLVRTCLRILKRGVRANVRGRDIGKGIVALVRKLAAASPADLVEKAAAWAEHETALAFEKLDEEAAAAKAGEVADRRAVVEALCEDAADLAEVERRCDVLFSDTPDLRAVMLSTVHRAKGLEADTVYILASTMKELGDLLLPEPTPVVQPDGATAAGPSTAPRTGEEQNILYVAITRAKTRLVWAMGELSL
jgi:superfamily I DNA/RNA helicase